MLMNCLAVLKLQLHQHTHSIQLDNACPLRSQDCDLFACMHEATRGACTSSFMLHLSLSRVRPATLGCRIIRQFTTQSNLTSSPRLVRTMASQQGPVQPAQAAEDQPHSRIQGAHAFLVQEHGASSIKMLVAASAGLSVLHFGVFDANAVARVASLRTMAQYMSLIWFGATSAIAFVEAPVKFQAPSLTRAVGLDVGRHVFSALNKLEIPAAVLLLYAHANGATAPAVWAPLLPVACVALETVWLLPRMFSRAAKIIAGKPVEKSRLHAAAGLLAAAKLGGLFALAWMLRK